MRNIRISIRNDLYFEFMMSYSDQPFKSHFYLFQGRGRPEVPGGPEGEVHPLRAAVPGADQAEVKVGKGEKKRFLVNKLGRLIWAC